MFKKIKDLISRTKELETKAEEAKITINKLSEIVNGTSNDKFNMVRFNAERLQGLEEYLEIKRYDKEEIDFNYETPKPKMRNVLKYRKINGYNKTKSIKGGIVER